MNDQTISRTIDPSFTTQSTGRGTDLDLAAAYTSCKECGDYLDPGSKPGAGIPFRNFFPERKAMTPKPATPLDPGKNACENILIVDDEEMVIEVNAKILERFGYTVLRAGSGGEAIQIYQNEDNIDLVILDMIMPDMRGGETYDGLKTIDPGVKVLLASGCGIDGQIEKIIERGCNGFIQKPFGIKELTEKLREILDNP